MLRKQIIQANTQCLREMTDETYKCFSKLKEKFLTEKTNLYIK